MRWDQGYTSRYQVYQVDPMTWRDIRRFEVVSGTIERQSDGLLVSANIEVPDALPEGEHWLRIYLDARQEGEQPERVALFTGLTGAPERAIKGGGDSYTVDLYSSLKPAEDILLQRGWYAPVAINTGIIIQQLLAAVAPVEIDEGAPALDTAIIADDSETALSMAQKIVDAINWRIRITGDGVIHVEPKPTQPAVTLSAEEFDVIETEVTESYDWFSCPNVLRATLDDTTAVARDDDPDSILSTVTRGREVWMEAEDVSLADGESLSEFAARTLSENQAAARTLSYDRRFVPGIGVGDLTTIHYPAKGLDGKYRVKAQTMELGKACKTSEEVEESK